MNIPRIYYGAIMVFCMVALVIGMASAATMTKKGTVNDLKEKSGHFGLEKMLDNLTEQGYDVSVIRTAVTSGDTETVRTLMQEFRTAHKDAFPARSPGVSATHLCGKWRIKNNQ